MQRAEAKDYRDIAKILETGLPLDRGLGAARAIFRSFFFTQPRQVEFSPPGIGSLVPWVMSVPDRHNPSKPENSSLR